MRPTLEAFAEGRLEGFSDAESWSFIWRPPHRPRPRAATGCTYASYALLQRLQSAAAVQLQAGDWVSDWFDDRMTDKLIAAGIVLLGELAERVTAGGCWYYILPSMGTAEAQRIALNLPP
jgi:hypothetical protein